MTAPRDSLECVDVMFLSWIYDARSTTRWASIVGAAWVVPL